MFKDNLKYIPITTVIIAYLFVCGGIFLVGFWSTFDVDAFSIIQMWDIPKNFIAPFMVSGGVALAITAMMVFFINKAALKIVNNNPASDKGTRNRRWAFIIIVAIAITLYFIAREYIYYWSIACYLSAAILIAQIIKMPSFINLIKNFYLRLYLSVMIIITLLSCFILSKAMALQIYNNTTVQIIHIDVSKAINNTSATTDFKLLGFLGDKVIISSLDNKNVIVLNQSTFDAIGLEKR